MSDLTTSLTQIKSEMRAKILTATVTHGTKEALSKKLGKDKSYVNQVLRRDSFTGLQKLSDLIDGLEAKK